MDDDTVFDPALVRRLARPARRPGLVDLGHIRALLARHRSMTAGLPLAEVAARYVDATGQYAGPAMPVVYAQPAPPPQAVHRDAPARPAGASPTGPATTTVPDSAVSTSVGSGPLALARLMPADRADGSAGPAVPARPSRSDGEASAARSTAGPGADAPVRPVTPRPASGHASPIERKTAEPVAPSTRTGTGEGSRPLRLPGPADRPASAGAPTATGEVGGSAGSRASEGAAPAGSSPVVRPAPQHGPDRHAGGQQVAFPVPAAPTPAPGHAAGRDTGPLPTSGRRVDARPTARPAPVPARRPVVPPVRQLPLAAARAATAPPARPAPYAVGGWPAGGVPPRAAPAAPARSGRGGPGYGVDGGWTAGGPPDGTPRATHTVPQPQPQPQPQPAQVARAVAGHVTDQVHHRILRRLAVEAERRGVRR
ncbi:hypothetical protein ACN27G_15450 [Plantactinospora sp. WMMB334]|uniref:hypothetical protein n=1 Tax=Plantactinospora sp. WMMB334 TaxID=3404119 RepID=UPI003B936559